MFARNAKRKEMNQSWSFVSSASSTTNENYQTGTITYNWPVDIIFLRSCICGEDAEKPIISPTFEGGFFMLLYPKDGSLYLQITPESELLEDADDELFVRANISIIGGAIPVDKTFEGMCSRNSASTPADRSSLGVKGFFDWDNLLEDDVGSMDIFCDISYVSNSADQSTSMYHLQRLSRDLNAFRQKALLTDVVLRCHSVAPTSGDISSNEVVKKEEFAAHRMILAARSSVFAAMFTHEQMSENQEKAVDIPDISPEVMEPFLAYIYTGTTKQVDKYSTELLVAADKYDIQPLIKVCVQSMLRNIRVETAAKIFYMADLYRLMTVKHEALSFITNSVKDVMKSPGWAEFIRPKPELMEQLLMRFADKKGIKVLSNLK